MKLDRAKKIIDKAWSKNKFGEIDPIDMAEMEIEEAMNHYYIPDDDTTKAMIAVLRDAFEKEAKAAGGAEAAAGGLSPKQLDAFSSLIGVLLSMVPERDLKEVDAADPRTGESIPVKKFIAVNYAIVTNGKRTIKFKGESE